MGDTVQLKMEKMMPELNELEERGLFTRPELSEIVKQRRKFEYRLHRHSPLKQDYLSYIDYEKRLDRLRVLRKKLVAHKGYNGNSTEDGELKKKKKKGRKAGSDYAGVNRVLDIYERATERFKGDVELWFRYLDFCREKNNGRMKKVQAKVFRLHPKVPSVWIYAAAWEFDHNFNVKAARNLMQNGLRNCPNSEDLWVEYLRMELTYLNKLKARKVALGEEENTLIRNHKKADQEKWRDENKELFMSLDEKRENDDVASEERETITGLDLLSEKGLSIIRTIYGGAIEALPSSFGLRTRFIEILEATNLDNSEDVKNNILADMKRDFSKEPAYWDWLARTEITGCNRRNDLGKEILSSHLEKAIEVYEEATKVIPSPMMFCLCARFLRENIISADGENQSSEIIYSSDRDLDLISRLLKVYERAESTGCVTEDLACQHVTLYLQLGKLEKAKKLAEELCTGKLSNAVDLWVLRISIAIRCITEISGSMTKADISSIFGLLKKVLSDTTVSRAESLWLMALKSFVKEKNYLGELLELSLHCLTRDGGSDDGFSLSSAVIELLLQTGGIKCARKTYKRFLALPRPGLVFYKKCIELESNLAFSGDKGCLIKARELYESALATYEHDVCLWRNYYSMEIKMGTSETANSVYWRAKKQLKENVVLLSSTNL